VTADVEVPEDGLEGVIIAQGGRRLGGLRPGRQGHVRLQRARHPRVRHRGRLDTGYESGTTVSRDHTAATSRFTGRINWVQVDLGKDDDDHFIDPDERLRIAMARQ
jgi:hypothetical protein